MTVIVAAPTPDVDTAVSDDTTHFICCMHVPLLVAGTPAPTLCGVKFETTYDGLADEVDCVVCNHMAWSGCCPNSPDQHCFNADDDDDDDEDD